MSRVLLSAILILIGASLAFADADAPVQIAIETAILRGPAFLFQTLGLQWDGEIDSRSPLLFGDLDPSATEFRAAAGEGAEVLIDATFRTQENQEIEITGEKGIDAGFGGEGTPSGLKIDVTLQMTLQGDFLIHVRATPPAPEGKDFLLRPGNTLALGRRASPSDSGVRAWLAGIPFFQYWYEYWHADRSFQREGRELLILLTPRLASVPGPILKSSSPRATVR